MTNSPVGTSVSSVEVNTEENFFQKLEIPQKKNLGKLI